MDVSLVQRYGVWFVLCSAMMIELPGFKSLHNHILQKKTHAQFVAIYFVPDPYFFKI